MSVYRPAAVLALVSLALVGCAGVPLTQPMSPKLAAAIQPVDVKIGITQPELYASFERSTAGAGAAAACGAVPGLGVLLAAACGGAMGAVDASVNASRAKVADETVRPLKDELVDLKFDQLMNESVAKSLQDVPGMKVSAVAVTKTVNEKAYEETYRASSSSAVMFFNVDYHVSTDFSTVEISARGLVYPRGTAARTAAGLPGDIPSDSKEAVLAAKNAVYRVEIFYHAKLPTPTASPAANVTAWKAEGARALRFALQDGTTQMGRLLADDLQRVPGVEYPVLAKVDVERGGKADLISESHGGKLLRYANGTLHFTTTASTAVPANAGATATLTTTAIQ